MKILVIWNSNVLYFIFYKKKKEENLVSIMQKKKKSLRVNSSLTRVKRRKKNEK